MFEQLRIRTATPADAESLAALAERTFRDTFADDNSTDDIEAYVRDSSRSTAFGPSWPTTRTRFYSRSWTARSNRTGTPSSEPGRRTRA